MGESRAGGFRGAASRYPLEEWPSTLPWCQEKKRDFGFEIRLPRCPDLRHSVRIQVFIEPMAEAM